MTTRRVLAVFFGIVVGTSSREVCAQILAGPFKYNGHTYYLLEHDTWTNSEKKAIAMGGHLAIVNDAKEDAWIYNTFSKFGGANRNLWIGLNDRKDEGKFVWSSSEPVAYTHWKPGEPNNANDEDYVHYYAPSEPWPGQWNDLHDDGTGGFGGNYRPCGVVEISCPTPSPCPCKGPLRRLLSRICCR